MDVEIIAFDEVIVGEAMAVRPGLWSMMVKEQNPKLGGKWRVYQLDRSLNAVVCRISNFRTN